MCLLIWTGFSGDMIGIPLTGPLWKNNNENACIGIHIPEKICNINNLIDGLFFM